MLRTPSSRSTATIGKAAYLKFAKTATLALVAASAVAEALVAVVVLQEATADAAASAVVEALVGAMDVVDTEVEVSAAEDTEEVDMEEAVAMVRRELEALAAQAPLLLPSSHRTPSPTASLPVAWRARRSTSRT